MSKLRGLVLLACLALGACRGADDRALMAQACALGEEYRWEEAEPLLKRYLLAHPDDASAHFLLGRCYMHRLDPWLANADGEYRTARQLLRRTGTPGYLEEKQPPAQFEATVYREMARVHMRRSREAFTLGVPEAVVQPELGRALEDVERGLALDPDSESLKEMQEALKTYVRPATRREPRTSKDIVI